MFNRVKGTIARIILNKDDYALYCVLSVVNRNSFDGVTYSVVEWILCNYLSKDAINLAWRRAFAGGYIRRIGFTEMYIIGADILLYPYTILL